MKIDFWLLIFFWGSGDAFWTITKYIWFISFIIHSLRYFQSNEWKALIPSHFKPFINVLNETKLQSNWNDRFAAEVKGLKSNLDQSCFKKVSSQLVHSDFPFYNNWSRYSTGTFAWALGSDIAISQRNGRLACFLDRLQAAQAHMRVWSSRIA